MGRGCVLDLFCFLLFLVEICDFLFTEDNVFLSVFFFLNILDGDWHNRKSPALILPFTDSFSGFTPGDVF